MTSIDDLFRKPNAPAKRKLGVSHDPSQFYKSVKLTANGDAKGKAHAHVEDEPEGEDDLEAGPAPPAEDGEDDYGPEDDEEGRFFGGGVDQNTAAAIDYIDKNEASGEYVEEKFDITWLKKLALNFEKKVSANAAQRAKFEDQPEKFMASEADLDDEIKALSILSEHPELYSDFAKLGCVASLISLLAHENTDIAIDAIEIFSELTDEDVDVAQEQWDKLVNAALDADLLSLLVSNFSRLDESNDADRSGVYHSLNIIENLASKNELAERIGKDSTLIQWLLTRIQRKESPNPVTQNKQYAAELLSILLQSSVPNRQQLAKLDGVDILLQQIAPYRKRDPPKDSEEEEFLENVFDALVCMVDIPSGKTNFLEAEGVELCLIMMKEGKFSKHRALRLLDHALGGLEGGSVCEKLVEAAGLKTIFSMFVKEKKLDAESTEHLLGTFAALLRSLPDGSSARIRTLAKFVEGNYEKIAKIIEKRREYTARLSAVDERIKEERKGMGKGDQVEMADEWFSRRLDAGLSTLQTLDQILAWLVAEDAGAGKRVKQLLADRDESLKDVRSTLQEQLDGIEDESTEEGKGLKEMLSGLVYILET